MPKTIDEIHDAILMEILVPQRAWHTAIQDIALKNSLLDIMQNGGGDAEAVSRLFRAAVEAAGDEPG